MDEITKFISAVVGTISMVISFCLGSIASEALENATLSVAEQTPLINIPLLQLAFFLVGIAGWVIFFVDIKGALDL
jgi:hypothetical protein